MAKLNYPSGLKIKAPLAWFTAFFTGLGPFVVFNYVYAIREAGGGELKRDCKGEDS